MRTAILSILVFVFVQTATAQVAETAQDIKPILVGTEIPHAQITSMDGKQQDIYDIVGKKPTVLVFYRGNWCMYCRKQLGALQEAEEEIKKRGYKVIGVSADKYDTLKTVVDKHELGYTLISDNKLEAAKAFGIAFKMADKTVKRYKTYGLGIEEWSGQTHHQLPVPAIFVIEKNVVKYHYVNPNYKSRLEVPALLGMLSDHSSTTTTKSTEEAAATFEVDSNDVNTVDHIIGAMYDVISGPPGKRDWNRFKSLCMPSAQFNALARFPTGKRMQQHSLADYIEIADPFFTSKGFFETETGRKMHEFGNIVQVFSAYESRLQKDGMVIDSGINSIQLANFENRWWVVNIMWDTASKTDPIPADMKSK
jgi:peroxiredoxin